MTVEEMARDLADQIRPADMLNAPPGLCLGAESSRRATCLALALELVRGRSVPIQVVERLARWLYSGEAET